MPLRAALLYVQDRFTHEKYVMDTYYVLSRGAYFTDREPYHKPRSLPKDNRTGSEVLSDLIAYGKKD